MAAFQTSLVLQEIRRVIKYALDMAYNSDLIVTSAGVSKGDYDVVKDVLFKRGKIKLWSVRMRPAKPLAFGVLDINGKVYLTLDFLVIQLAQ